LTSFHSKTSKGCQIICVAALIALSCCLSTPAKSQSTHFNQYKRTQWSSDQGLSAGRIQALAQTPDGYLWVGTVNGLFRFDGFRFLPVLTEEQAPLRNILGLTVDRQGTLWVRAADMWLRQVRQTGISTPVVFENKALNILSMSAAQTTGIYATDVHKSVFRLIGNHVEALPIHSKSLITAVAEASDQRLWIGTDRGLLSWIGNALKAETGADVDKETNCLLPSEDGHVWIGTDRGLAYWDGRQLVPRLFAKPDMQHLQVLTLMEDRDKNLWAGTSRGLLRYTSSGAEWASSRADGQEPAITALMQDREGDIWFGSGSTLERLESAPVVPVELGYRTFAERFGPLYVDHEGRAWFANLQQGLYWMQDGKVHAVTSDGLANDEVYSIDGDGDDIWVGRRRNGLTRLRLKDEGIESQTWTTRDGLSQNSVYAVRAAPDGTVWAGTLTAGVNRLQDGHFIHFSEESGLPSNAVSAIEIGAHGQVWIGTSGGICQVDGSQCSPLSRTQQGLGAEVYSLLEDPFHGLWVGTSRGLFLYTELGSRAVRIRSGPQPAILGLGLDQGGRLWITSDDSVMSAKPIQLLASQEASVRTYGEEDGLKATEIRRRSRTVVADSRGQVWISTGNELVLTGNEPGPLPTVIPHVEDVIADGVVLSKDNPRVPAGVKRLSFAFTGLDLHAPLKVRFRYRLDDFDKTWNDAISGRQATYTNLAPGKYTFRLIASNQSKSWTSEESTVPIVVEPLMWQRWSVRSLLAAVFAFLAVFAYHTRTRILLAQANVLAEERLRERTRIARDVHDTLLQGFISSLMHLHVADKQIASDSPLKDKFAFVLDGMERVIEEARLAVVGLRAPESGHECFESSIRDFFLEVGDIGEADLSFVSTGRPRPLKPAAYQDLCAISREAILNAVRHADARVVQVTIAWGWLGLKLRVSDNGRGMDAHTLENGRAQHWGLASIRERAQQMKGRLLIESHLDEGTKVSLSVPAATAYRRLSKLPNTSPTNSA
jgi:ligand-binding sensor domain-containing protein/signal transduction histidine kinase